MLDHGELQGGAEFLLGYRGLPGSPFEPRLIITHTNKTDDIARSWIVQFFLVRRVAMIITAIRKVVETRPRQCALLL